MAWLDKKAKEMKKKESASAPAATAKGKHCHFWFYNFPQFSMGGLESLAESPLSHLCDSGECNLSLVFDW